MKLVTNLTQKEDKQVTNLTANTFTTVANATQAMQTQAMQATQTLRQAYVKPAIEIIEMETEGTILTGSDFGNGGHFSSGRSGSYSSRNAAASSSDLEDLIDDILTVEQ